MYLKIGIKIIRIIITNISKYLKFSEKNKLWTYKHKQKLKQLRLEL